MDLIRRAWPLVIVALLVPTAGCDDASPSSARTPTAPSTRPATLPKVETMADHRSAARIEADRIESALQLPPGTRHLSGRPSDWPMGDAVSVPAGKHEVRRVAWYQVNQDRVSTERYLRRHPAVGLRSYPDEAFDGNGVHFLDFDTGTRRSVSTAYDNPYVRASLHEASGRTIVRVELRVLLRSVRSPESLVTGTVTAVDLVGSPRDGSPGMQRGHIQRRTVTDNQTVARLVATVNGLAPSAVEPYVFSCPPFDDPPAEYRIVFRTDGHATAFAWEPTCRGQIRVIRDGVAVRPTLEPGAIDVVLDRLLLG